MCKYLWCSLDLTADLNAKKNRFTLTHEPRNWAIKLKVEDAWRMKINGDDITGLPEAPKNTRAIEEIHKSETLPNYSETK